MSLPLAKEGLDAMAKSVHDQIVVAQHWHESDATDRWQKSRLGHALQGLQTAQHCITQISERLAANERKAKGEHP